MERSIEGKGNTIAHWISNSGSMHGDLVITFVVRKTGVILLALVGLIAGKLSDKSLKFSTNHMLTIIIVNNKGHSVIIVLPMQLSVFSQVMLIIRHVVEVHN